MVLLTPFPEPGELLFIDEFHYRTGTQDLIARRLADRIVEARTLSVSGLHVEP